MAPSPRLAPAVVLPFVAAAAHAQCALQWQPNAGATPASPTVLRTLANGDILAAGDFTQIGGVACNRIARYDGSAWQPLGAGLDGPVRCAAGMPNHDVLAAGSFTMAGTVPVSGIARWNGVAWSAFAPAPSSGIAIEAIEVLPNGHVVVGGSWSSSPFTGATHVEIWDGASWRVVGTAFGVSSNRPLASLVALAVTPAGGLLALGDWVGLQPAGNLGGHNELVLWDGTGWHHLGERPGPSALLAAGNGDVWFAWEQGVRRFDGASWTDVGTWSDVRALAELPDGDLVAGGGTDVLPLSPPPVGLQRFDGAAWSPLAAGTAGAIEALASHASGQLLVGGGLRDAGGAPTTTFLLSAPCPARLGLTGTLCAGPAGPLLVQPSGRPWTGTTYRTTASGFAANALGAVVLGFGQQFLPLANLHPSGLPNCLLLANPDALQVLVPVAGTGSHALAIPDAASLAGTLLYQQFLQAEIGAHGAVVSLSSSARLTLLVGVF